MKLNFEKTLLVLVVAAGLFITNEVKAQPLSFAEALTKAVPGRLVEVSIVTNQDNGVVAYMTGTLAELRDKELKAPGSAAPWVYNGAPPLTLLLSDRMITINPNKNSAILSAPQYQPFRFDKPEHVDLSIQQDAKGLISATFTMTSSTNTKYSYTVNLQSAGNVLYGEGAPIEGSLVSKKALYIISFPGVTTDTQKPNSTEAQKPK